MRKPSRTRVAVLSCAGLLLLLNGCGSDPVTPPMPLATPEPARSFLYLVTTEPGNSAELVSNRLVTYRIDPWTGAPSLSGSPTDFNGRSRQIRITADPSGRLLYVDGGQYRESGRRYYRDSLRSYRIDPEGRLTLAGEVPREWDLAGFAASSSDLYVWSVAWSGGHHHYDILQSYTVDSAGALAATPLLVREHNTGRGYSKLVGADPGRDVFYFSRGRDRFVVAAVPDATADVGYREIGVVDGWEEGLGDWGDWSFAAGGFLLIPEPSRGLKALAVNESTGRFESRGFADGVALPQAFGGGVVAGLRRDWTSGCPCDYYGIEACLVSGTGALTVVPGLPVGTFAGAVAIGVHPSGRYLYVAGTLGDAAPPAFAHLAGQLVLWTVRVDPAGLTLQEGVPILPELGRYCRQIVVVTVPS